MPQKPHKNEQNVPLSELKEEEKKAQWLEMTRNDATASF